MSANPIPLLSPMGIIFAYACPTCFHVADGGSGGPYEADRPPASEVDFSRRAAIDCCTCSECGAVERGLIIECVTCSARRSPGITAPAVVADEAEEWGYEYFMGPCVHGRDPYDRCDYCGESAPQVARLAADLGAAVREIAPERYDTILRSAKAQP